MHCLLYKQFAQRVPEAHFLHPHSCQVIHPKSSEPNTSFHKQHQARNYAAKSANPSMGWFWVSAILHATLTHHNRSGACYVIWPFHLLPVQAANARLWAVLPVQKFCQLCISPHRADEWIVLVFLWGLSNKSLHNAWQIIQKQHSIIFIHVQAFFGRFALFICTMLIALLHVWLSFVF